MSNKYLEKIARNKFIPKLPENVFSKAKSLLGNKKVLAGGLVSGAVGLGAGAAYLTTKYRGTKEEKTE